MVLLPSQTRVSIPTRSRRSIRWKPSLNRVSSSFAVGDDRRTRRVPDPLTRSVSSVGTVSLCVLSPFASEFASPEPTVLTAVAVIRLSIVEPKPAVDTAPMSSMRRHFPSWTYDSAQLWSHHGRQYRSCEPGRLSGCSRRVKSTEPIAPSPDQFRVWSGPTLFRKRFTRGSERSPRCERRHHCTSSVSLMLVASVSLYNE